MAVLQHLQRNDERSSDVQLLGDEKLSDMTDRQWSVERDWRRNAYVCRVSAEKHQFVLKINTRSMRYLFNCI